MLSCAFVRLFVQMDIYLQHKRIEMLLEWQTLQIRLSKRTAVSLRVWMGFRFHARFDRFRRFLCFLAPSVSEPAGTSAKTLVDALASVLTFPKACSGLLLSHSFEALALIARRTCC